MTKVYRDIGVLQMDLARLEEQVKDLWLELRDHIWREKTTKSEDHTLAPGEEEPPRAEDDSDG